MTPPKIKRKIWNKVHLVKAPVWTAKFTSNNACPVCGTGIKKGQVITRTNENRYAHYSCVSYKKGF